MKESTRLFAEKQCVENKARMEREAKGNYGMQLHIVASYDDPVIPIREIHKNGKVDESKS